MNVPAIWYGLLSVMLIVATYLYGYQRGIADAPEMVAFEKVRDDALNARADAFDAAYLNSTSATCDKIFGLVIGDLNALEMDEGEHR